jgi:hypothetical protein
MAVALCPFDESPLNWAEFFSPQQAFNRGDGNPFGLDRQSQAGIAGHAVDEHRAGAALPAAAALLGAVRPFFSRST